MWLILHLHLPPPVCHTHTHTHLFIPLIVTLYSSVLPLPSLSLLSFHLLPANIDPPNYFSRSTVSPWRHDKPPAAGGAHEVGSRHLPAAPGVNAKAFHHRKQMSGVSWRVMTSATEAAASTLAVRRDIHEAANTQVHQVALTAALPDEMSTCVAFVE